MLDILLSIVGTLIFCAVVLFVYVKRHTVGTFRFDNNATSPMCTFELEKLPEDFEKSKYVLAKVAWADLSLPGTHESQH